MNRQRKFSLTYALAVGLPLVAAAMIGLAGRAEAAPSQYAIDFVIAPYHSGVNDSWFFGINNQGQATGYIRRSGEGVDAVIYRDGDVDVLAHDPSNVISSLISYTGMAINDIGDVVGYIDNQPHFFAADGTTVPIQVPPGFDLNIPFGYGNVGLNDSGKVLIDMYRTDVLWDNIRYALWDVDDIEVLSVLDPLFPVNPPPDPADPLSGPSSVGIPTPITSLNNANQFAARVDIFEFDPGDPEDFEDDIFNQFFAHAYTYDGQGGYSILEPSAPGDTISPVDIDESGGVLGWVNDQSLALWGPDGSLLSMLPDPGVELRREGGFGYPSAQRNNLGQAVAITSDGGVVLYDPALDAWTDITASIAGLDTGIFSSIQGFNDLGQFVGLARPPENQGGFFAYVVTPVPEPATCWLVLLGGVVMMAARRTVAELK